MRRWGSGGAELVARLTPECLAELIEKFGGRAIWVPRSLRSAERAARLPELQAMLDQRASYREAAAALGISKTAAVRRGKMTG